jgi:hypothetical protein
LTTPAGLGRMQRFTTYDGTELAYRLAGRGRPLVCLTVMPPRRSVRILGALLTRPTDKV